MKVGSKKKPVQEEIPDWLESTPEYSYSLTLYESGDGIQSIDMNREEYVALKRVLGKMRGYKLPNAE